MPISNNGYGHLLMGTVKNMSLSKLIVIDYNLSRRGHITPYRAVCNIVLSINCTLSCVVINNKNLADFNFHMWIVIVRQDIVCSFTPLKYTIRVFQSLEFTLYCIVRPGWHIQITEIAGKKRLFPHYYFVYSKGFLWVAWKKLINAAVKQLRH